MSTIVTASQREVKRERAQHDACRKALYSERQNSLQLQQVLSSIKSQVELLLGTDIDSSTPGQHQ